MMGDDKRWGKAKSYEKRKKMKREKIRGKRKWE
jgi:hypothetical protein